MLTLVITLSVLASDVKPKALTIIHVDDDAAPWGDGSGRAPYNSIADAVEAGRLVAGAIRVQVAPGTYPVSATIAVERALQLRGSNVLLLDDGGLPTGELAAGTETRLVGMAPLSEGALIQVGRSDAVIAGVDIRGFTLVGPPATVAPRPPVIAVSVKRVQGFSIVGNVVAGSPNVGFETIAASGRIAGNYIRGVGAGTIIAAGYPASPSKVVFVGNRSIQNRNGGILLNGSSTGLMELGDLLEAEITGNDLSHSTVPSGTGFGVRVYSIRRDRADPGGMQSVGNIHALIRANLLVGNDMGVSIDAGFPYRAVGTSCDTRSFSGTTRLEFKGNTISGSRVTSGLISFTRQGAAINPAQLAQWQYFHGGTFTLTDPDRTLASAWIDHPEFDPFIGPCADDVTMEPLGNTLIYNGGEVARGTVTVPGR